MRSSSMTSEIEPTEEEPQRLKGRVIIETPDNCDGCGANRGHLNPIEQSGVGTFGKQSLVVGYECDVCEGIFMYRM